MSSPPVPLSLTPSGRLRVLDQTRLPDEEVYVELDSVDAVAEAIRALRVRGAPLIGITAALGLVVGAESAAKRGRLTSAWVRDAAERLAAVRPTAVNLQWALTRILTVAVSTMESIDSADAAASAMRVEAMRIWDEDRAMCRAIGEAGAALIPPDGTVLTHCNAGVLATGGIGTALAAVYVARERGWRGSVLATETRPLRQGARLTAWELSRAGIPVRVIADGAAAGLMVRGGIDVVLVGADRIAANGDVANKVGTYALAIAARAHGVPFYVAAPSSTIDAATPDGAGIPIEQRDPAELAPPPGVSALNPAFDVTPAALVTGIVTEGGMVRPPYRFEARHGPSW